MLKCTAYLIRFHHFLSHLSLDVISAIIYTIQAEFLVKTRQIDLCCSSERLGLQTFAQTVAKTGVVWLLVTFIARCTTAVCVKMARLGMEIAALIVD